MIDDEELDTYTNGINEEEVEDEDEDEVVAVKDKKKKTKAINFGKIATAIGRFREEGIEIAPPDINLSNYTFTPDVENNIIRYGLTGITRVGIDVVKNILKNRPYTSLQDLLSKVKLNKVQVINLIKSGALDVFGDRVEIMKNYVTSISDLKKTLNLRNVQMLMRYNLIADDYKQYGFLYNFNTYIKKSKKGNYYELVGDNAYNFYKTFYDEDLLIFEDNSIKIPITTWTRIYEKDIDKLRQWIKQNLTTLLKKLNDMLFQETWDKYCQGNLSKWEMDSVSFYSHEHELAKVNMQKYDLVNFFRLDPNEDIDRTFSKNGKEIVLYKIYRIAGTVLQKNKTKHTVTLLTTNGIVNIKIFGDIFTHYDRQLSEKLDNGKKKVIEKSWLSRGNKIIVTGIRKEDNFIAKKYKNTPFHLVEKINEVDTNGNLIIQSERVEVGN